MPWLNTKRKQKRMDQSFPHPNLLHLDHPFQEPAVLHAPDQTKSAMQRNPQWEALLKDAVTRRHGPPVENLITIGPDQLIHVQFDFHCQLKCDQAMQKPQPAT